MSEEFQTIVYGLLTISGAVISYFLIDTLRSLRDAIKELTTNFKAVNDRVSNHDTRITVLESR